MPTPPKKPIAFQSYIFQAIHAAISDADGIPQLLIPNPSLVEGPLPKARRENSPLILNISLQACINLHFGEDRISFRVRMDGRDTPLEVPYYAVAAMFDRETKQGQTFLQMDPPPESDVPSPATNLEEPLPEDTPASVAPAAQGDGNVLQFPKRR